MATAGPRTTNRYSVAFKAKAVRLSCVEGVMVKDVAESLAIHPFMRSLWRKQAREGLIVTKGVAVDIQKLESDWNYPLFILHDLSLRLLMSIRRQQGQRPAFINHRDESQDRQP
jgi:transposase